MPISKEPASGRTSGGSTALPSVYRPDEHEARVNDRWERAGAFTADPQRVINREKQPYCILIPPPNVTGALHLGHALNNTLQDVLMRAHRMKGFETLWMPGTDHAGIATQTVVDKRLQQEGKPSLKDYKEREARGESGREQFIQQVQLWKDEYERRITDQLKAMGCSCDWSRRRFTMDEICARAVREAFFRLFKEGLIYRGKRLVNWDPVSQTALADDEVEMQEVEGRFYYLRYPLVHPGSDPGGPQPVTWSELATRGYPEDQLRDHPDEEQAWVTVATTRPETYLGDTAVAVNPSDPRAAALEGLFAQLPLLGRLIPIIQDDYVVMPGGDDPRAERATGFLKITPAHDPNDWEIGQRHAETIEKNSSGQVVINVMAPDASISDQHGWTDVGDAHIFVGKSRDEAREMVVKEFENRGRFAGSVPHRHSVGHSYRSHAPIEPYLSDQWYVKVTDDRLAGAAQRALAPSQRSTDSWPPKEDDPYDGAMTFHPKRYAKMYESWHENIRDWCISRQLWWGHRIPVWSDDLTHEFTTEERDQLKRYKEQGRIVTPDYKQWPVESHNPELTGTDIDRGFFCVRDENDREAIDYLNSFGARQDPDVLDTWFSSALWPLSTMGWPEPEQSEQTRSVLDAFNPTNVLCTARDIVTLWVSRMVMFNRFFNNGEIPFRHVYIHPVIQDGEGKRMSKSAGNGVDPMDIIHSHGADALRYTLCNMAALTQDVRLPVETDPETGRNTSPRFDLGQRFCNKLWNASRFTMMMLAEADRDEEQQSSVDPVDLRLIDRWMLSRLAAAHRRIEHALDVYEFNAYAEALYDLLWRDFCDWYLEAVKPTVKNDAGQRAVLRATLDAILRLLHPVCPFVTESIFEALRSAPDEAAVNGLTLDDADMLATAAWPRIDDSLRDDQAEQRFDRLSDLVTEIRDVRARHRVSPKRRASLHTDPSLASEIERGGGVVEQLAGLQRVTTEASDESAAVFTFDAREHRLGGVEEDKAGGEAERQRLEKQIAELDQSIAVLRKRLDNPGYVQKAPAHLVQQTRDQLADLERERAAAAETLRSLS